MSENLIPVEAAAVAAQNLLETALSPNRKVQCGLFGRHFSSTQKVEVVKKGATEFLNSIEGWKRNLEALLVEIEQNEANTRLQTVVAGANNLSAEEIQRMIEALQAKKDEKAA